MKKETVTWQTVVVVGGVYFFAGIVIGIELLERLGAWIEKKIWKTNLAPSNS